MSAVHIRPNLKLLMICSFMLLSLGACAHHEAMQMSSAQEINPVYTDKSGRTYYKDSHGRLYYKDAAGQVVYGDELLRHYFVDESGRRYYFNDNGIRYYIDNGDKKYLIGEGGTRYYVDEYLRPYYLDQNGNRVYAQGPARHYFIDEAGRKFYLEETGPGVPIDPLSILRGEPEAVPAAPVAPAAPVTRQDYCNSQWNDCAANCNGLMNEEGLRKRCLDNCDRAQANCNQGY